MSFKTALVGLTIGAGALYGLMKLAEKSSTRNREEQEFYNRHRTNAYYYYDDYYTYDAYDYFDDVGVNDADDDYYYQDTYGDFNYYSNNLNYVDPHTVKSIPPKVDQKKKKQKNKKKRDKKVKEVQTCTICFDNLRNFITLNCSHSFHRRCINEWVIRNSTCPICRTSL